MFASYWHTRAQKRSRNILNRAHAHARAATDATHDLRAQQDELHTVAEQLDGYAEPVRYTHLIRLPLVAYIIDVFLFSQTVEFLVGSSFEAIPYAGAYLGWIAMVLLPAAFILMEIMLSIAIYVALDNASEQGRAGYYARLGAGIVIVLGLLAFALATQVATLFFQHGLDNHVGTSLLIGLGAIVIGLHAFILMSGRSKYYGKTYLSLRRQRERAQSREGHIQSRVRQHESQAVDSIYSYSDYLDGYNTPGRKRTIDAGPFEQDLIDIVNRRVGYELLATQARKDSTLDADSQGLNPEEPGSYPSSIPHPSDDPSRVVTV
jgi:hypothetical protein